MRVSYSKLDPAPFEKRGEPPHHILPIRPGQRWAVVGSPVAADGEVQFLDVFRGAGVCVVAHEYIVARDPAAALTFVATLGIMAASRLASPPKAAHVVVCDLREDPSTDGGVYRLNLGMAFLLEGPDEQ
jgi:hypothetical protein